jgi:putative PIN family toxin of toxin-antitoxin system
MRVVIDTNIAFSAILNTNSRIARIILMPKSRLNFYSTKQLLDEIQEHEPKLLKLSKSSQDHLSTAIALITGKIRFIDVRLISKESFAKARHLTHDVDVDDTEFVALAEHIKGKLWTGDKELLKGLTDKGWNKFATTEELGNRLKIS